MHNMRKENLGHTETGRNMFIRIDAAAEASGDHAICEFIRDVLRTYDGHGINSHIT